jgi:hypothetical protein
LKFGKRALTAAVVVVDCNLPLDLGIAVVFEDVDHVFVTILVPLQCCIKLSCSASFEAATSVVDVAE